MPPGFEYNIDELYQEAKRRWLKPMEVLYILQNHEKCNFTNVPPQQPPSGSLFLFNRRVMRFFRKDGHNWRKKKDGRSVGEAHERLKVGNVEILNCYYAHGEQNRTFQRRSYWMLDPAYEHVVLVHYRETSEVTSSAGPVTQLSTSSYSEFSQSRGSYTTQNPGTTSLLDDSGKYHHELFNHDCPDGNEKHLSWMEVLESCKESCQPSCVTKLPAKHAYDASENGRSLYSSGRVLIADQENSHWLKSNPNNAENSVFSCSQDIGGVKFPPYSLVQAQEISCDYYATLFDQIQEPLGADSNLTVSQKHKFTIREVSPEWCYATETAKVIIIGSFLCLPSDSTLACMFGDIEVPAEIIQDGVICCEAPRLLPGKVTLCITSGNRESCSEVREFEFRNKTNSCNHCNSLETEAPRSPEELLLLVRFAQMLLSDPTIMNDNIESVCHLPTIQKADDDSWSHIIDTLLVGSGTSSGTLDWLLEELLKDKLQQWLSGRSQETDEGTGCSLSKKEQVIIHMVAGLGFEWALSPILSCGVNLNFRDISGWTALHWAARFGREKMVASLIAAGAFAGAVTDPTSQDPSGKTAASIAASSGHKGLAGYLSEAALVSHLSSLTLEESEISKGSAVLEAELTVNHVSSENLGASEDHVSLKDTLAAVRNAVQAAARIQAAFHAHSFRKRREREAAAMVAVLDGYGVNADSSGRSHDYNSAALSIQKKYRGWKSRKDFLALRQKVVKIQAHVRGYQVRKQYKQILWAVGIFEKIVLRWRRKGAGLRGFQLESESIDESEDEDFLKVFRQQKVHAAIEKALSRVLSMVHSRGARQQYRRMLEMYREAKAELGSASEEAAPLSTFGDDASNKEDGDFFQFPWETL